MIYEREWPATWEHLDDFFETFMGKRATFKAGIFRQPILPGQTVAAVVEQRRRAWGIRSAYGAYRNGVPVPRGYVIQTNDSIEVF